RPAPAVRPTLTTLLDQVLAGLGDHALVKGGRFGYWTVPYPPHGLVLDLEGTHLPLSDVIDPGDARGYEGLWQAQLVAGAVRDLVCTNREGQSLVRWRDQSSPRPFSTAYGQRFANPAPAAFRTDISQTAQGLGLKVVSVQLL